MGLPVFFGEFISSLHNKVVAALYFISNEIQKPNGQLSPLLRPLQMTDNNCSVHGEPVEP
jgi:hypothetical protein